MTTITTGAAPYTTTVPVPALAALNTMEEIYDLLYWLLVDTRTQEQMEAYMQQHLISAYTVQSLRTIDWIAFGDWGIVWRIGTEGFIQLDLATRQ